MRNALINPIHIIILNIGKKWVVEITNPSFYSLKHKGRDLVQFFYLNNYQNLAKHGSLNCPNLNQC